MASSRSQLATASSSSQALGTATSYGFVYSSADRFVRQRFPDMTSISGSVENTYFLTVLYRWDGYKQQWVQHGNYRGWYNGASNGNGKLALSSGPALTFYWILNGNAIADQGVIFNNLPAGYYRTAEYYTWQNGATAARWSFENGSNAWYCKIG